MMRPFLCVSSRWCSLLLLLSLATFSRGLNVGDLLGQGKPPAGDKDCSRTCESEFCTIPPVLRYGKYCGILYSGCPGEKPCDALDACCMVHDHCVADHNSKITRLFLLTLVCLKRYPKISDRTRFLSSNLLLRLTSPPN
uniref:Uncharacterized protein n=1 Tax=Avena sativa TaxID=4498 RepID=A0ACD5X1A4_AVESA